MPFICKMASIKIRNEGRKRGNKRGKIRGDLGRERERLEGWGGGWVLDKKRKMIGSHKDAIESFLSSFS